MPTPERPIKRRPSLWQRWKARRQAKAAQSTSPGVNGLSPGIRERPGQQVAREHAVKQPKDPRRVAFEREVAPLDAQIRAAEQRLENGGDESQSKGTSSSSARFTGEWGHSGGLRRGLTTEQQRGVEANLANLRAQREEIRKRHFSE